MQRIVITSSCAAVLSLPVSKPTVFSEKDWNLKSVKEVQEMGIKSNPASGYRASKTLAEKGMFFFFFFEYLVYRSSSYISLVNQLPGIFMSFTSPRLNGI